LKHFLIPGVGALMNLAELFGVVYLALTAGGTTAKDAYKSLAIVGVWILIGLVWAALNPNKRQAKDVVDTRRAAPVAAVSTPPAAITRPGAPRPLPGRGLPGRS